MCCTFPMTCRKNRKFMYIKINAKWNETDKFLKLCASEVLWFGCCFRVNFPRRNISVILFLFFIFFRYYYSFLPIQCLFRSFVFQKKNNVFTLGIELPIRVRAMPCRYGTNTDAAQRQRELVLWSYNFCRIYTLLIIPLIKRHGARRWTGDGSNVFECVAYSLFIFTSWFFSALVVWVRTRPVIVHVANSNVPMY